MATPPSPADITGVMAARKAGWVTRILNTQRAGTGTAGFDGLGSGTATQLASAGAMTQCGFTPMRPNTSLLRRLEEGSDNATNYTATLGAMTIGNGASRPQTVETPQRPTQLPLLDTSAPPSARKDTQAATELASPTKTMTPGHSDRPTTPRRAMSAHESPGASSIKSRATTTASSKLTPLHVHPADSYTRQEHAVMAEMNVMRRDPPAYAAVVAEELRVGPPFLAEEEPQRNVADLHRFACDTADGLAETQVAMGENQAAVKREVAAMQEQWAREDQEKAKRKGKPAAPRKGQAAPAPELTAEELEAKRRQSVVGIENTYAAEYAALQDKAQHLHKTSVAASRGVRALRHLIAKLRSTPKLPPFAASRALALAARDVADKDAALAPGQCDIASYAAKYGTGAGPFGYGILLGHHDARQTVLWLLLAQEDTKRRARVALLAPEMRSAACGWRHQTGSAAVTAFLTAASYSELDAVASRSHLPLQRVRRELLLSNSAAPKTGGVPPPSLLRLRLPQDVVVRSPAVQPASCGNLAQVVLRAPAHVDICAALCDADDEAPTRPAAASGDIFVQREGGTVTVRAAVPRLGRHALYLFSRTTPAEDGVLVASLSVDKAPPHTPRGAGRSHLPEREVEANVAGGYVCMGAVEFVAKAPAFEADKVVSFPLLTADFSDRRCRIVSPCEGLLAPNTTYLFHLVVPLTSYKEDEVSRVSVQVAAAQRLADREESSIAEWEARAEASTVDAAAAKEQQQQQLPQLQQDLAAVTKDSQKKKGKELERMRAAAADLDEKMAALQAAADRAERDAAAAAEQLAAKRQAARRAAAQAARYLQERDRVAAAIDRSEPLCVEVSVDGRLATVPPVEGSVTDYSAALRTPRRAGRVCLFVRNVLVATYTVAEPVL